MYQASQLINRTTEPNVWTQLLAGASEVQALSEEALPRVWGIPELPRHQLHTLHIIRRIINPRVDVLSLVSFQQKLRS